MNACLFSVFNCHLLINRAKPNYPNYTTKDYPTKSIFYNERQSRKTEVKKKVKFITLNLFTTEIFLLHTFLHLEVLEYGCPWGTAKDPVGP